MKCGEAIFTINSQHTHQKSFLPLELWKTIVDKREQGKHNDFCLLQKSDVVKDCNLLWTKKLSENGHVWWEKEKPTFLPNPR